ncbi:MAG: hypothetical protein WDO16_19545 [Bacteroidota bacterium]
MKNSKDTNQPKTNYKPGGKLKDKIHRHLNDKNDIITEEDIRDILTENKTPEEQQAEKKEKTK